MARHRLTAADMATLSARMSREMTVEDFMQNNALITQRIGSSMNDLKLLLNDPRYLVTSSEGARQQGSDGIVKPYTRDGLHQGNRCSVKLLLLGWTAVGIMHEGQTALILQQQAPLKLQ
jgi:hypothetical protein